MSSASVEDRLKDWASQHPSLHVSEPERMFIEFFRASRAAGVGYGWMQQVIEWEWNHLHGNTAWGPEYFHKRITELEAEIAKLKASQ